MTKHPGEIKTDAAYYDWITENEKRISAGTHPDVHRKTSANQQG